jgi:hypothetical protein
VILAAVLGLGFAATPVWAGPIAFNNSPVWESGGTIEFNNAGVTVSDAKISAVASFDPFLSTGLTGLCGGKACLNFVTGGLTSTDGTTFTFGGGGALTIVGNAGNGQETLLSTAFDGPVQIIKSGTTGTLQGTLAGGFISPTLATLFGVSSTVIGGTANSLFYNLVPFNGGYSGTVIGANDVQVDVASVPEPSGLILLGLGVVVVARRLRRRAA